MAVAPAVGLNPNVEQVYPIVNSLFAQMTGREDITAVDTESLIAMGQQIQDLGKLDLWLNTLARRIGLTIDTYRVYRNKFSDLSRSQLEWGAIVQKLTAEMPEATEDKIYDIGKMDGQSVDHYIINNPKIHQRFFDKETPYSFFLTTSTKLLKDAFLGAGAMQAMFTQMFGKVQNKIEFTNEELARICVANFMLHLGRPQHFHLVSMYNNSRPLEPNIDTDAAKHNPDFLRFAIGIMNNVSNKMENMSIQFNADKFDRFTPKADQRFYMLADFKTMLETVVQYEAFNPQYVSTAPDIVVPYWQSSKYIVDDENHVDWSNISSIAGTVKGKDVELSNIVAILFDREALGTFREEEEVLTTPVNARAAYYNTFWHEKQLWFNDMSENGVVFFLD